MNISDNKKNILNTISAYSSFMQSDKLSEPTRTFSSLKEKEKSPIYFMFDIIKTISGDDGVNDAVSKLLVEILNNSDSKIKPAIANQFIQFNSNNTIPNVFNTGIVLTANELDLFGDLKLSKDENINNLLFDKENASFNSKLHDAIINAGTDVVYNNLVVRYDYTTNSFIFKNNPATLSQNQTIGEWFGNYINNTVFISKKEFISQVLNNIYGTISINQNKTVDEILKELEALKIIENYINDDDSLTLSENDFKDLLKRANELADGVMYYDLGCGLVNATISLDEFKSFVSQLSGLTDSFIATNIIDNIISSGLTKNNEILENNKHAVRDGFLKKFIDAIIITFLKFYILSPQIRMLQAISNVFRNGNVCFVDIKKDLKNWNVFIKCLIKEITNLIGEFLFNLTAALLIKWLTPVTKKILKEKILQQINIIKSLI